MQVLSCEFHEILLINKIKQISNKSTTGVWMLQYISDLKRSIVWSCTAMMATFLNRSINIIIIDPSYIGKRSLCHSAFYRNDAQYLTFSGVRVKCSNANHFVFLRKVIFIWSIYHGSIREHNMIPFLFQILVELVYFILVML